MVRRESDNENWGGARPGAGRPRRRVQISLDAELAYSFRKAHEESIGRIINNGEFDEILENFINKSLQGFIEAPKPPSKWTVCLFHGTKELQEIKDLSEEDALKFAVAHRNVDIDGMICNAIVAWPQGYRNSYRRWNAGEKD